jgi:hypothetical protein
MKYNAAYQILSMEGLYDQYEYQLNKEIDIELINLWQITLEGSKT